MRNDLIYGKAKGGAKALKAGVLLLVAAGVMLMGCGRSEKGTEAVRRFTPEVTIRTTPVKDQGRRRASGLSAATL